MSPALVPHVVLVPRPSEGHLHPFLSLARFLAASGVSATLIYCHRSHDSLSSAAKADVVSQPSASLIRIEVIQADILSSAAGDANMCEALDELLQKLMQEDNPPCCVIGDVTLPGCHKVALKFGLPRVILCTFAAFIACLGFHIPEMIARGYIPAVDHDESQKTMIDFIPELSPIRIMDLPSRFKAEEGLQSPGFVYLTSVFEQLRDADRTLVNTMPELESIALEALAGAGMVPVGPLFKMSPISAIERPELTRRQEDKSCLSWLDQQEESSVLYISFGSVATVEKHVFEELAYGVEASGESFLWVIRPDAHKDKAMTAEELLPEGFVERTGDRGLVISWAPQLTVLAHPSVGAFLTHCGWNSVLESLSNGIPMLGFPQAAEQNTNLKYVVEDWKVGLPLLKADVRNVERVRVQQAVDAMMKGIEGREARKHAREWRDIANKAPYSTSKLNLEKFVDDLKQGHVKPLIA